jgi:uncharacterized DUF497 family protein
MLDKNNKCRYIVDTKDILFEWDQPKNISNINKHDVGFEEATTAFDDNHYLEIADPEHSDYQERFIVIGISARNRLLVICHTTLNDDEVCRIISARLATKTEERQYGEMTNARRI